MAVMGLRLPPRDARTRRGRPELETAVSGPRLPARRGEPAERRRVATVGKVTRWRVRTVPARRLFVSTVAACFRYRVTGLAAEAGFFALLSLPPLALGLVGALGYFSGWLGPEAVESMRASIVSTARQALSEPSVKSVIEPYFDDALKRGRPDIASVGFLLSLWSGSRALNVFVDTITIMYGLGGRRGIIRTRALSFSLYVLSLLAGTVVLPLVLAGPDLVSRTAPGGYAFVSGVYWPTVLVLSVFSLTTLYHLAVPVRTKWRRNLPGATLSVTLWIVLSFVLRVVISESLGSTSVYGPLSTPIIVLIWLYFIAISVLIGAALNAAVDVEFPTVETVVARQEAHDMPGEAIGTSVGVHAEAMTGARPDGAPALPDI